MRRRKLSCRLAFAAALCIASFLGLTAPSHGEMIFVGDMETGDLSQWKTRQLPKPDSGGVVSSVAREGNHALRVLLRRHDEVGRERAEVMPSAHPAFPQFRNNYHLGEEYWYAVSIYLPPDWVLDDDAETLFQFHASPDRHLREPNTKPPLALGIEGTHWRLFIRGDNRPRITKSDPPQFSQYLQLAPIAPGVWSDWVFRIKWSCGADGILQVWKDGQLVAEHYGMNTYNDRIGPYLKLGIYKHVWIRKPTNTDRREVYFDSLRIMRGTSSYEEMVAK